MIRKDSYFKLLKGIVICKDTGQYILDFIFDTDIDPMLLSSFVGALSLFGKSKLGNIEEIDIKGLDVEMVIVAKHGFILIAILDKEFPIESLREEAEKALDMFCEIAENINDDYCAISEYEEYKGMLKDQIIAYFEKINEKNVDTEFKDFGFFTDAIKRMKSDFTKNSFKVQI